MGATTTEAPPLTVTQARQLLRDTSRVPPDRVDAAEKAVSAWNASRPRNQACVACSSLRWEERTTADGRPVWCCAGCGRSSALTSTEWYAQRAAAKSHQTAEDARIAAAAPAPRAALAEALTARQEAQATVTRLEAALPAARSALGAAQAKHAAATAEMTEAESASVQRLAAGFMGERASRSDHLPVDSVRGKLRLSEDAVQAARGSKALLEDRLHFARQAVSNATTAVRTAALAVLAEERLEDLIATAIEARASYLDAIAGLGFLLQHRAPLPSGDRRAHQLVKEASESPPAQWRESATADGGLAQRLAQLESGKP